MKWSASNDIPHTQNTHTHSQNVWRCFNGSVGRKYNSALIKREPCTHIHTRSWVACIRSIILLYSIVLYRIVLYSIILYSILLYSVVLYSIVLYSIVLYRIVHSVLVVTDDWFRICLWNVIWCIWYSAMQEHLCSLYTQWKGYLCSIWSK